MVNTTVHRVQFVVFLFALLFAGATQAAVIASIDRANVELNESFTLKVTVSPSITKSHCGVSPRRPFSCGMYTYICCLARIAVRMHVYSICVTCSIQLYHLCSSVYMLSMSLQRVCARRYTLHLIMPRPMKYQAGTKR